MNFFDFRLCSHLPLQLQVRRFVFRASYFRFVLFLETSFILSSVNWWAKCEKATIFIINIHNGRITPILDLWPTRSHLPFTWWWWWLVIEFIFFSVSVMYQIKNTIQCGLFSIKFNHEYVTVSHQFALFDREPSASSTQQRKFHFVRFYFFYFPDRISHEIHKGWNKSPLVIWFFSLKHLFFSEFCICRTQWKNKFNSSELWCEFSQGFPLVPSHLRNIKKTKAIYLKIQKCTAQKIKHSTKMRANQRIITK